MEAEIIVESEKVAKVSKLTLYLMASTVAVAGLCAALHTHVHGVACSLRILAMILGALALLRILNSAAVSFPTFIAKPIHWVHAMTFELFALIAVIFLRLLSFVHSFEGPVGPKEGTPILLVHGYVNSASVWIYIRQFLAKGGFGPIYALSLGSPFASIRDHAKKVAARAEQIRRETGKSELILIGHSMGGLVSSYYATQLAPFDSVQKLITIASPLKGTYMAKLALGANGREMEPRSPFLKELTHIPCYNIGTKTDQLIVPASSSLLGTDPTHHMMFEDLGHASLLYSPRVASQLKIFLTN
jgi:pimeloyl-ACP methyl ester carboxylesterase